MEKRVILVASFIMLTFFSMSLVLSVSNIDSEIKKVTYYAQEYETGNIGYVKLLVYVSNTKQSLNEILGATEREMGGVLKQEKIREILGEPVEETKWVWVEGEEQDRKLDSPVPVWKKIIFDGKKIQIRLNAWPSIFSKKEFIEENEEREEISEDLEGKLIYRLDFEIEFKKPEEQLDIEGKIDEIKILAEEYDSEPSQENAEALAKESVNAEKKFESYFRQGSGKCEDIMASIFGSESETPSQNMIVQEISFYEGEKFEVIARLEMCDECDWNWINLDLWAETRGPMPKMEEEGEMISPEQFKDKDDEYYQSEIINLLDSYKKAAEEKNWKEANRVKQKLWVINEAWNQKSNDLWKIVEEEFKVKSESMTQKEQEEFNQNYGWIKQDQERRKKEKELRKQNYEKRKQFYMNLFSSYDKKEYSFVQKEFKKRLIELFKEKGEEICNNNLDDNQNEKIDCGDDLCTGQVCGKGKKTIIDGNETKEIEVDFYCMAGECREKTEMISETKEEVCGNHICGGNESSESCAEDCNLCPKYAPIECSGKVIFKGKDINGCPLEPVCIEEQSCVSNDDCRFLCGVGECVEGKCQAKELNECAEEECIDGTQRTIKCESGESIISSICSSGLWTNTGISCLTSSEGQEEQEIIEEIVGGACTTRSDCGGENDVCSNGRCISLPEIVEVEEVEERTGERIIQEQFGEGQGGEQNQEFSEQFPEQSGTEEMQRQREEGQLTGQEEFRSGEEQQPAITGQFVYSIKKISGKISGFVIGITGFDVEETSSGNQENFETEEGNEGIEPSQETSQRQEGEFNQEDNFEENFEERRDFVPEDERREGDERREQEDEQRSQENKERCEQDCSRPCVEKCIRDVCGESMECNIDEESTKCETSCEPDNKCVEKCVKGEGEWWKEFENKDEFKEQEGGFEAGGSCRTAKGRTEGFMWFGGWGQKFEKIQPLKNKYYSGGNADWCEIELQNLIKQRKEFEKGFNQEFAKWFFEDYLANSAENWEQAVSGIFELYWKNVDNQREIAFRMKCMDESDIGAIMNYSLININYETDYGKLEYWEEAKPVKIQGMDEESVIISPYMKLWIFPSKEFIQYEMKKAMKNHEFPGPPEDKVERKNQEGLTPDEKERIKQDKKFMEMINTIAEKYGGSMDLAIQFKDLEKDEIVFNLYVQVNEDEIIKMTPMLPEEVASKDATAEIDFEKIYDLIYSQEKEMAGERIESPPWDRKIQPTQKIKEIANGVGMYFKVRSIMNSAKITPEESEKDIKNLFKKFMSMMMKGERGKEMSGEINSEAGSETDKTLREEVTGKIISR